MYKPCMLTEDKKGHAFYMLSSDADAINRSTLPPIFYDEINECETRPPCILNMH